MENRTLDVVAAELVLAKAAEKDANAQRVALEQEIIGMVGLPEEGVLATESEAYKIKVEQRVNRKVDEKKWALVCDQIPEAVQPVSFVEQVKLDTAGIRWLKDNEPGYYNLLCEAMTEKPAKPSVKVEVK